MVVSKPEKTTKHNVDVVDLRAQADASMPASNNNNILTDYICTRIE